MKKISLLAMGFIAMTAMAQERENDQRDFKPVRTAMAIEPRFGLRAGVNLSTLELDDDNATTGFETQMKTSLHGGVFFNLPVGDKFRVQPEVTYSRQGSKVKETVTVSGVSGTSNYELDFHYLTVPVMLQLKSRSGFFFEAGPQFGYLLSAKRDNTSGSDTDMEDMVRTTDFSLNGGIGYLTRVGLGVNARYVHGLSNVWNTDDAPAGTKDREVSNRTFQLGFVYHFGAAK